MPWEIRTVLDQRRELILLLRSPGISVAEAARRCKVSRETARMWRDRHASGGDDALSDLSRCPARSPERVSPAIEDAVVALRREHPAWGGRKLARLVGVDGVGQVAPSTVTDILRRNGLIGSKSPRPIAVGRFEREGPNDLWQMDYKGPVVTLDRRTWHPLTIVDDHSRSAIALTCCADQTLATLRPAMVAAMRTYGTPRQILADNGSPWRGDDPAGRVSQCEVWLMDRGVEMIHGRPRHPQTQGKDERFNGTLETELLKGREYADGTRPGAAMDRWRPVYNYRRPHDALGLDVPASRYQASERSFEDAVQPWEHSPDDAVRKVFPPGRMSFAGRQFRVGRALAGREVGVRPTDRDGVYEVWFRKLLVRAIDLRTQAKADMR